MKLKNITPELIRQAAACYLAIAFPRGGGPTPEAIPMPRGRHVYGLLKRTFVDDSHFDGPVRTRRYSLRLGNQDYPHMKLVLAEFMERGQFFFMVDTHDELRIAPDSPDHASFARLRMINAALKETIERRWEYCGVPTFKTVQAILHKAHPSTRRIARPKRILIVDDDFEIAAAMETALCQKGYKVHLACDGTEALEKALALLPDLVLMDYNLPKFTGAEACARLKQNPKTASIPVLLATTTPIELVGPHNADGFLVKPFQRRVLLGFVERLLACKAESASETKPVATAGGPAQSPAKPPVTPASVATVRQKRHRRGRRSRAPRDI